MPTEAFFKLDDNKREQILKAAVKEFSELPYAKVSIFKIAQHSGVSRSGFYYYFKDKKDIYEYLLKSLAEEFMTEYKIGSDCKIGIFQLAENIFDYIAGIKGTDREPFFRRVVSDITPESLKETFLRNHRCGCSDELPDFDMSEINAKSCRELRGILFLLTTSIIYSIGGYLDNEESLEDCKDKLYEMFDVIKFGTSKGIKE